MVGPDDSRLNGVTKTGGRPPRPPSLTHFLISPFSPRGRPRPVWRHLPSDPVPLSYPSRAFLCRLLFLCSSAFPPSVSLLHLFSLLVLAGIEPHPGPVQDPCSVCCIRVYAGWVAFLCMVCNQWCHRRYAGIHSSADYQLLAPWSCPTCSTQVPPAQHPRTRSK